MINVTRVFDLATIIIDGRPLRAMRIVCRACGRTDVSRINTFKGADADAKELRLAEKRFRKMGWRVGDIAARHRCPACVDASNPRDELRVSASAQLPELREVGSRGAPAAFASFPSPVAAARPALVVHTTTSEGSMAADPKPTNIANLPRVMSREDRRIVFQKLNEVYVGERDGYAPPWTDKKIALDLGVPQAWVANVREEMFGPIGSNAEIDHLTAEAAEVLDQARKFAATIEAQAKALLSKADMIERKLADITKAVRP